MVLSPFINMDYGNARIPGSRARLPGTSNRFRFRETPDADSERRRSIIEERRAWAGDRSGGGEAKMPRFPRVREGHGQPVESGRARRTLTEG